MPVLTQKPAMQAQLHDDNREASALHPSPSGQGETDALLVSEMVHPRPLRGLGKVLPNTAQDHCSNFFSFKR